ncbi:hypothetical protein Peur_072557 [Populus x canadensis]
MEVELKEILNDLDSLRQSLPDPSSIYMDMSAEVVDSNPYSRLMALQRMGSCCRALSAKYAEVPATVWTCLSLPDSDFIAWLQGYNSLKDYFPTMEMRPNPQCSNAACLERQKEYLLEKPAGDAAIRAKMEAEALLVPEGPLHADNEWDIRGLKFQGWSYSASMFTMYLNLKFPAPNCLLLIKMLILFPFLPSLDALPEGLTRELPTADEFQKAPAAEPATTSFDDIEELRKQLDALNAD